MASMVKGSGKYDYRITESNEKKCSIDFYQKTVTPDGILNSEMIGNSTFTIEDARKAGTQNLEKFPKNMLFARCISNGVKFYTPDVFSGPVYTPEEMDFAQPIKEEAAQFEVINPVTDAIAKIAFCNSLEDLTLLKETLDKSIYTHADFKAAAMLKVNEIKAATNE
jgi:hypothetical protein